MKYWVFNQQQLADALTEYSARINANGDRAADVAAFAGELTSFLHSTEAHEHDLIRGDS